MNALSLLSRSSRPPLWREGRLGLKAAALLRDPVLRGEGLADGRGRPALLIPGFLAGDASLSLMADWLRRAGYRPSRAAKYFGGRFYRHNRRAGRWFHLMT